MRATEYALRHCVLESSVPDRQLTVDTWARSIPFPL